MYHTIHPRLSEQKRRYNDLITSLKQWMNTRKYLLTHQGNCTFQLTVVVTAYPKLVQTQDRRDLRMEGQWAHNPTPTAETIGNC